MNTNGLKPPHQFNEDSENQNPNITIPCCNTESSKLEKATMKSSSRKKKLLNELPENSLQNERKPKLKNTFSARNLFAGRELLNQIMEFCSELKNLRKKIPVSAKKGMPEENGGKVSGDLEERVGDRERVPLVGVEEGEL
uniref:Uncharacterized protein n=1 Tax=Davidia involucrata TaxID=16924 RepID=A0A5B6YVG5_DAVIN